MQTKHRCSSRSASKPNAKSITPGALSPAARLLHALWQSSKHAHQLGVMERPHNHFKHIHVANVTEAVALSEKMSNEGNDVYFACAEYITPSNRRSSNVAGAYAFWLDIDCGKDKVATDKGYRTVDEARCALSTFCKTNGLPNPTHIVYSGSGLHVYWGFNNHLPRDVWQLYAKKLKDLTKASGFKVDDTRTSDIASVLRVPGTFNYKYFPPRPVLLIYVSDSIIEQSTLLDAIDTAHMKLSTTAKKQPTVHIPKTASSAPTENVFSGTQKLERLASALTSLDPDCDEETWKLKRLAPLAREAFYYPEMSSDLCELARSWSSGELRGSPSVAWNNPGGRGVTGEEEFDSVWLRFCSDNYDGTPVTIATIYYDAKQMGWKDISQSQCVDPEDEFQILSACEEGDE